MGHVPADRRRDSACSACSRRARCAAGAGERSASPLAAASRRGARRRGAERAAPGAPAGAPAAAHGQRRRSSRAIGEAIEHARRARPPRRAADRAPVRPDAASKRRGNAPGSCMARAKTPLPQWWIGPRRARSARSLSALTRAPRPRRARASQSARSGRRLIADIWRSQTVPGANDNLSGVAALVALAELLAAERLAGLRVLLVSCGAEETLQDGIRAFVARHRDELPPERTTFVNLDTVGSPHLVMLEAEGPVWMEQLHRAVAARPRGRRRRAPRHPARARLPRALLDGQRDPEPRRLPDDDARLDHRLARAGQLPPAQRHAGEPRLRDRRGGDAAWSSSSPGSSRRGPPAPPRPARAPLCARRGCPRATRSTAPPAASARCSRGACRSRS